MRVEIAEQRFDVADVDEPATVAAEPTSLFSDRPVDLTGLDLLNLDLNLRVDEVVTSEDGGLDQIDLGVKLSDGELTVAPIRFVYAGGGLSGRFELKRSPEVSVWLNLEGNDIYLGQVLAQIRDVSTLRGVVSIDAELRAQGNSSRALVSSLGGKVGLVVEGLAFLPQGPEVRQFGMGAGALFVHPPIARGSGRGGGSRQAPMAFRRPKCGG